MSTGKTRFFNQIGPVLASLWTVFRALRKQSSRKAADIQNRAPADDVQEKEFFLVRSKPEYV
jgi:hypothetical protein